MDAAVLLRNEARIYARKLVLARLAGTGRNILWRPMALKLIRLARLIESGQAPTPAGEDGQ